MSIDANTEAWPRTIRVSSCRRTLTVEFDDGVAYSISAERLRTFSPSAEVRGHSAAHPPPPVTGKAAVTVVDIETVGHYAVRLIFDDGHSSGIYTWAYLRSLGKNQDQMWAQLFERLSESAAH